MANFHIGFEAFGKTLRDDELFADARKTPVVNLCDFIDRVVNA